MRSISRVTSPRHEGTATRQATVDASGSVTKAKPSALKIRSISGAGTSWPSSCATREARSGTRFSPRTVGTRRRSQASPVRRRFLPAVRTPWPGRRAVPRCRHPARSDTRPRSTTRAACWCDGRRGREVALSMAMVRVESVTSEASPPMTPATACGRDRSAMTSMPSSACAVARRRRDRFTRQGLPDAEFGPLELVQVERVDWVTQFHEHVVVTSTTLLMARMPAACAVRQPRGEGPTRTSASAAVVARAERRASIVTGNEMGFGDGVSRRRAVARRVLNASATRAPCHGY